MPTLTDTGAALLRGVLEDPDSDHARLVYADWLEETGADPARAEFIRTQIKAAEWRSYVRRHNTPCPRWCRCGGCLAVWREGELFSSRAPGWALAVVPDRKFWRRGRWSFGGGFLESLRCTETDFRRHAAALFAAEPIMDVWLTHHRPPEFDRDVTREGRVIASGYRWLWSAVSPYVFPDHREAVGPRRDRNMIARTLAYETAFGDDHRQKFYRDEADALAALSRLLVGWGRHKAGLPQLPDQTQGR